MSKDMFVLSGSGGITGKTIKDFIKEGHKEKSRIIYFQDPKKLIKQLVTN
jgi:hypothetical protein